MTERSKKRGLPCIYCGSLTEPAPDHVPPRALFARPRPPDLITVPSCAACNAGFSKDDEYFRDVMVMRREVAEHPLSEPLLKAFHRSLDRPEARGRRELLAKSTRDVEVKTPTGLYLGKAPAYIIDKERVTRVLDRITRGLAFDEYGITIPDDVTVTVDLDFESDQSTRADTASLLGNREFRLFGRGEFQYASVQAEDNTNAVLWVLVFYGVTPFLTITTGKRRLAP